MAEDGVVIEKGHVYIARPGHHLLVKDGKLLMGNGPSENGFRPSIDALFRSAAAAYASSAIGVILTGLMHDGTSGMEMIKHCGGTLIVQDPADAAYADMPQSVLSSIEVDYTLPLAQIGSAISYIISTKKPTKTHIPEHVLIETRRAERMAAGVTGMDDIGERSPYGCPECGGTLWKMKEDGTGHRYRCHIGHAHTEDDLLLKQLAAAETGLWSAIRMMEERKHLMKMKSVEYNEKRFPTLAVNYDEKCQQLQMNIDQLKSILIAMEIRSEIEVS
jgi:two-component system chemotaxis response regulator CheB